MGTTIGVDICFICTIQPKRNLSDPARGVVLQLSGRPTVVSVAEVPEEALVNGVPSAAVLWQAEAMFLERQEELYPEHHVITWEAHYKDHNGPFLSRFEVLLPAQED